MTNKTIYLLRGVSGSGKTTLAKTLQDSLPKAVALAADDFWYMLGDGDYQFNPSRLGEAHAWCQERTRNVMNAKQDVIIHNTLTTEKEMKPYLDLAEEFGYKVVSLVMENRHGNESVHGVPDKVVKQQEQRLKNNIKLV